MCKSISIKKSRKAEVHRIHIATGMDFNRPDYEVDGRVCACSGRTAIIFNLQWKAKNFQKEEKIDKQAKKGIENESSR